MLSATQEFQQVFVPYFANIAVSRADETLPSSLPQRNSAKFLTGSNEQTNALKVLKAIIKSFA